MEAARAVPGVDRRADHREAGSDCWSRCPKAGSYLGFIFARGRDPAADVEAQCGEAHARLRVRDRRRRYRSPAYGDRPGSDQGLSYFACCGT